MQLSNEEYLELISTFYVDEQGWLIRKRQRGKEVIPRKACLCRGYPKAFWKGKSKRGHHIAWALYYKRWPDPTLEIDHIDRQRWNCLKSNLREVDRSANMHNTVAHTDAKSSIKGVDYCANRRGNKWRARICFNYTTKQLGYFETEEAAALALTNFKGALDGFCNC